MFANLKSRSCHSMFRAATWLGSCIVVTSVFHEAGEAAAQSNARPPDETVPLLVVDANGHPVVGAYVGVVDALDESSPIYAWAEGRAPQPAMAAHWARTDASGTARVEVDDCESDVVAIRDGELGHRWIAGWTESVTTIRVGPSRHLRVRAVDGAGRPLTGLPVVAERRDLLWGSTSLPCGDEAHCTTDGEGIADLGAVNLHFDPDDDAPTFEIRPVIPERVRSRVSVDLSRLADDPVVLSVRPTGTLEIVIVDAGSRPIERDGDVQLIGSARGNDRLDLGDLWATVIGGRAIHERVGAGWTSDWGRFVSKSGSIELAGSIPPVRPGASSIVSLRLRPDRTSPPAEPARPEPPQTTEAEEESPRRGARLATRLRLDSGVSVGDWNLVLIPPGLRELSESFSCWNGGIDEGAHRVVLVDLTPGTYDLVITEPLGEGKRGEVARVAGVKLDEAKLTILPPIDLRGRLHVTRLHLRDEAGSPIESGFVYVPDLEHDRGSTNHVDDGEAILASASPIERCEIDCGAARITRITPIDGDQTLVLKPPYRVRVVMNEGLHLPPGMLLRLRLLNSNPQMDYAGNAYDAPLDRSGEITIARIENGVIAVREATKYWFDATLVSERGPIDRGVPLLDPALGNVAFHIAEGDDEPRLRFAIGQSVLDEAARELK